MQVRGKNVRKLRIMSVKNLNIVKYQKKLNVEKNIQMLRTFYLKFREQI